MAEISVNLNERSYVITIGAGILARVGEVVSSVCAPTSAAVISNPTVAGHYAAEVVASLEHAGIRTHTIILPTGERFKTLHSVSRIYDGLLDMKMDRRGVVVALGGGVIGDIAGFAAATYMRGIDFVQVPTTLLAQVDASVGGKTGVDLPRGKNLVGAFHQPRAVVMDIETLRTLPMRELRSGFAEVVKHGIIYDREYFDYIDTNAKALLARDMDKLEHTVCRSVEIKRDVVQSDERESGIRAILNYGHTLGHSIEVLSGYGKYRHGEASSIGMVTEALLAEENSFAQQGITDKISAVLSKMRLPVKFDASLNTSDVISAIELDKKTMGGAIRLALPVKLGECRIVSNIDREMIARAIDKHKALFS
ncbi:3-dehydroquinate synthase [bacterium]|nr:3-dehydroquinate synthase [bacterium]